MDSLLAWCVYKTYYHNRDLNCHLLPCCWSHSYQYWIALLSSSKQDLQSNINTNNNNLIKNINDKDDDDKNYNDNDDDNENDNDYDLDGGNLQFQLVS